ncbi:hypothetical protein HQ531_06320 [bacterium]|nr:hypothetical protein [bacterium]
MEIFDSVPFSFGGKDFDIRILYDEASINVLAFLKGYPANGYRYQVKIKKDCDVRAVLEKTPVPELIEKCKEDLMGNTWEALREAIQSSRSN